MAYEFTDIDDVVFAGYVNNRNFSANFSEAMEEAGIRPPDNAGDIGPEHLKFIPSDHYGEALLLVSNPDSASITMYRVDCGDAANEYDDDDVEINKTGTIVVATSVTLGLVAWIVYIVYGLFNPKEEEAAATTGAEDRHTNVASESHVGGNSTTIH